MALPQEYLIPLDLHSELFTGQEKAEPFHYLSVYKVPARSRLTLPRYPGEEGLNSCLYPIKPVTDPVLERAGGRVQGSLQLSGGQWALCQK